MAYKILQLVKCCNDCPRKVYYSGGRSECVAAGTILPFNEGHTMPSWCPLIDYPSDAIERIRDENLQLKTLLADKAE